MNFSAHNQQENSGILGSGNFFEEISREPVGPRDPTKFFEAFSREIDVSFKDDPSTHHILCSLVDMLKSQVFENPDIADELINQCIRNLKTGQSMQRSSVRQKKRGKNHENTIRGDISIYATNFNSLLHASSQNLEIQDITRSIDCIGPMPFQEMVDRCRIDEISYDSLLRLLDNFFRVRYEGPRLNEDEISKNSRDIPPYIWNDPSLSSSKQWLILKFREGDLDPIMFKNISVLMNLYEKMKESRSYGLPLKLNERINKWLLENDVSIKSASKT